ncbi:hypothetical protein K438DRAFT_1747732 [Mycena galopus ATCC 62051]|nr:hypothetical protein K438DRAFT_1747732 [Mycena galopus ATCC 62051]
MVLARESRLPLKTSTLKAQDSRHARLQDSRHASSLQASKVQPLQYQGLTTSRPRFNLLYLSPSSVRNSSHRTLKTRLVLALRDTPQAFKFKRKTQDFKIQDSRTPQDASSSKTPQASVQVSRRVKTSSSVKTRPKTFKTLNFNLRRASTFKASRYSETSMGRLKTRVASRHLKTPQVQGASSFKTPRLQLQVQDISRLKTSIFFKTPQDSRLQDTSRPQWETAQDASSLRPQWDTAQDFQDASRLKTSRQLKTQDLKTAQDSRPQDSSRLKTSRRLQELLKIQVFRFRLFL